MRTSSISPLNAESVLNSERPKKAEASLMLLMSAPESAVLLDSPPSMYRRNCPPTESTTTLARCARPLLVPPEYVATRSAPPAGCSTARASLLLLRGVKNKYELPAPPV